MGRRSGVRARLLAHDPALYDKADALHRSYVDGNRRAPRPAHDPGTHSGVVQPQLSLRTGNRQESAYVANRIPGAVFIEHAWSVGAPDTLSDIDRFIASLRDEAAALDRVLATVLFTDIVDSTKTAADLGDRAWRDLLERHHATVRGARPLPRQGDRHGRRWVLRDLRRPRSWRAVREGHHRGGAAARPSGAGWTPHRRGRDHRRKRGRRPRCTSGHV